MDKREDKIEKAEKSLKTKEKIIENVISKLSNQCYNFKQQQEDGVIGVQEGS